ncbi:unnamed protein product [Chrysodeixis includens]|uniref:Uncharacterized protein n=1 Tax=Chrysodeixis includens TaxID=689277 RepID=A0A9P0BLQ1_CHRIL|nr:unnamed protein product [Chrysodeixis includens]
MSSICTSVRSRIHPQIKRNYSIILSQPSLYRYFSQDCKKGSDEPPPIKCLGPNSGDDKPTANMYDTRKYGHNISTDSIIPCFETLCDIPTGIFRCTTGEILGRGAAKCSYYQNPEYFSFHHMTFYDLNLFMRCMRRPSAKLGRKPV